MRAPASSASPPRSSRPIPHAGGFDSTLALLRDPYGFISERCRAVGADLFQTRLLLRKTVCMVGEDAAALFYDRERFVRAGAAPGRIQKTLFGRGGVQGLDGAAHRHRKQRFMALMTPERIARLGAITDRWWSRHAEAWARGGEVVLDEEVRTISTRAACEWAGVPLDEGDLDRRVRDLTALFDDAGSIGPKHWRGRLARKRADRWIERLVREVRAGRSTPPADSPLHAFAWHRDPDGELLPPRIAAVEVLNLLRPTVAVSVYVVFVAHALHRFPEAAARLRSGEDGYAELFVQEVRRVYPFFPSVVARVRDDFTWKGHRFPRGRQVMLDLYGTNHDPRLWEEPQTFRPERFRRWDRSPFHLVPQGGGDHHAGHRCAGEWITIDLMKRAARFLAERIRYEVRDADLRLDRARLPALPRSPLVLRDVRIVPPERPAGQSLATMRGSTTAR